MAAPLTEIMTSRICRQFHHRKSLIRLLQRRHTTMIDDDSPSSEEQRLQELKSSFSTGTHTPNAEKPIIPLAALPKTTRADTAAIEHIPVTENGYQFKKHPGRMKSDKITEIPEILENTLESIFKDSECKSLETDGRSLYNQLMKRQLPESQSSLTARARKIEPFVISRLSNKQQAKLQELIALPELTEDELKELKNIQNNIQNQIKKHLRFTTYHYRPLQYTADIALKYSYSRMIPNYSVLTECLNEIKRRDPDFEPQSLLNMGSGVGSAVWATNRLWSESVREYYCVDNASEMNKMAMQILKEGDMNRQSMVIPNVYFRDKLPVQKGGRFSLVICAYTLMDFPNQKNRLQLIRELWDRTEDYFILVDVGTYAGFLLIQEARRKLLKMNLPNEDVEVNIFAPCPHNQHCPKFRYAPENMPCNFEVQCQKWKGQSQDRMKERYSYVIFKRGKLAEDMTNEWPRIVFSEVLQKRHKDMAYCTLCCPDSTLSRRSISRGRNGRELYRMTCESQWGDLLPVKLDHENESNITMDHEDSADDGTGWNNLAEQNMTTDSKKTTSHTKDLFDLDSLYNIKDDSPKEK